jgi:hypothetical protein
MEVIFSDGDFQKEDLAGIGMVITPPHPSLHRDRHNQ